MNSAAPDKITSVKPAAKPRPRSSRATPSEPTPTVRKIESVAPNAMNAPAANASTACLRAPASRYSSAWSRNPRTTSRGSLRISPRGVGALPHCGQASRPTLKDRPHSSQTSTRATGHHHAASNPRTHRGHRFHGRGSRAARSDPPNVNLRAVVVVRWAKGRNRSYG